MKFLAKLQQMAASEIMNIIPNDIYEEIKRKDPHPLFQAYVVGHEGEATGQMVGMGTKVLNWFSSAINKIWQKMKYGTKIFHGHNIDSSHEGRQSIGEVVGKAIKTIQSKVNAIAITYIYPEYRDLSFDVASIEADVNINPDDSVHDVDVGDITGIALGNSAVEKPGFAGATLLSQIQAFANGRLQSNKEGENMPTLEEIKKFVGEEGISPSEIFGRDSLIDDPVVKGYVKATVKEETTGEYVSRKRDAEGFDKTREKLEAEKKELEDENKVLKIESAKVKAADLFSTKAKERKLDDKQAKFIQAKQDNFEPEDLENLEKEVDKFMDDKLEEFKKTAEIFGHKTEKPKDDEPKGGGEPGEGGSGEDNELIPD